MGRFRVSIASLLLVTAFIAVSLAALRTPSEWWATSLFSLALAALVFAMLGILYRRGRARAFWVGFALFGAGYLALSVIPGVTSQLVTTWLLDQFHPSPGEISSTFLAAVSAANKPPSPYAMSHTTLTYRIISEDDQIRRTGHALVTLLAGFVGGLIARGFFDATERDRERERESATAGGPP